MSVAIGLIGAGYRAAQVHAPTRGWLGLMLDHHVGRFSEASMSATTAPTLARAEVEIFGPGGAAMVDCTAASGRRHTG